MKHNERARVAPLDLNSPFSFLSLTPIRHPPPRRPWSAPADQMAVLASGVVCVRLRLLRCPTPGLVGVLVCIRLRLLRCPTPGLVV